MSKIGKKPIQIPKDAKIEVESGKLILTGPNGSKELSINDKIFTASISKDNNLILQLIKKNEKAKFYYKKAKQISKDIHHEKLEPNRWKPLVKFRLKW